ncbi:hypothetical protein LINGRAHAP2_LOCUS4018, partial [Linum grandiflorum]
KCGRIDHIKVNYPFTKKEKDKAFLAAWSASEDESEDSDGECISAYMEIATEEEHCDINNTNPEVILKIGEQAKALHTWSDRVIIIFQISWHRCVVALLGTVV